MTEQDARALLARFLSAWEARNLNETLACFAEDGVYEASVGPEPGRRATGRRELAHLLRNMFSHDTDAQATIAEEVLIPDCGEWVAWWTWRYDFPCGRIERGCDRIVMSMNCIRLKDAFRKVRL